MGWLTKLSFGRGGAAVAEEVREDEPSTPETQGPPLMVLVNDASGRASFKTHVFDDVESATEWVKYWFPRESEDGMTAFWAMSEPPESDLDVPVEPLVLIQDVSRAGVVYLFSFVDIISAEEFMREEVEHGTAYDAMNLYWAVQVKREIDQWGNVVLTPPSPPGVASHVSRVEASDARPLVARETPEITRDSETKPLPPARAVMEEAPNARTGVAEPIGPGEETFELTSWMERARKRPASQGDVVREAAEVVAASEESDERFAPRVKAEEIFTPAEAGPEVLDEVEVAAVVEEAPTPPEPEAVTKVAGTLAEPVEEIQEQAIADEEIEEVESAANLETLTVAEDPFVEEPTDADPEVVQVAESPGEPSAPDVTIETPGPAEVATEESVGEIVIEAVVVPQEVVDEAEGETAGGATAAAAQETTNDVTSQRREGLEAIKHTVDLNGHEDGDQSGQPHSAIHQISVNGNGNGHLDETIDIRIDIHLGSRALKMKRWEVKDEPFEGFNSPPGRF